MTVNKAIKTFCAFFKKILPYWTILAFLAMVIYIGFVFYQYVYKSVYRPQEASSQKLEINESAYKKVMSNYSQMQKNIEEIFNKNYLDPFK